MNRDRPIDHDVAAAVADKWKYIASNKELFDLSASDLPLLEQRSGVALWSTVYYERRYKESCADRYYPDECMPDMFDEERAYQTGAGQVAYFDIPPEYAEEEAAQMRDVATLVALYPSTEDYACADGSPFCKDGVYETIWKAQTTPFTETRGCMVAGEPSCYEHLLSHFSVSLTHCLTHSALSHSRYAHLLSQSQTLDERARRTDNAISTWVQSPSESGKGTWSKHNGFDVKPQQSWTIEELDVPTIPAGWERTLPLEGTSDGSAPQHVLQTTDKTSNESITLYTPGTAHTIGDEGSDSHPHGYGGASMAQFDVNVETRVWIDRPHGFESCCFEGWCVPPASMHIVLAMVHLRRLRELEASCLLIL